MKIVIEEKELREKCIEVNDSDKPKEINELISEMIKTMIENQGVGIAAPQVGINKRLFIAVIDKKIEIFINPEVIDKSDEMTEDTEGCLSVPNCFGTVPRHKNITIKYCNGREFIEQKFEGFNARVVQHEYDHLEGILYTDKAVNIQSKELIKV
jgi:peptide deformylase